MDFLGIRTLPVCDFTLPIVIYIEVYLKYNVFLDTSQIFTRFVILYSVLVVDNVFLTRIGSA